MKRLMYIYTDNEELTNKLKVENEIAYSERMSAFICYQDVFKRINEKYRLEPLEEDGYKVALTESLLEALESNWDCQEYIELKSDFGRYEKIEHNLGGDAEIALEIYEDDSYEKWEENAKELLASDDWYKKLFQEIRITMLNVILDSIKWDVDSQIKHIESE